MNKSAFTWTACIGLLMWSLASAVSVHMDVENSTSTTAEGYTRLLVTSRYDNGGFITLPDGIQVGWAAPVTGVMNTQVDYTTDNLLAEFLTHGAGKSDTLLMKNIPAGRYQLTIYGYDPHWKDKKSQYDIDWNNDDLIDKTFTILNRSPDYEVSKSVLVTVSPAGMLSIKISRVTSTGTAFNGFDLVDAPPDTTPPAAVQDLAVSGQTATQVMLAWTAPADDDDGAVASYDIRYNTDPITEANWATASAVTGEPLPAMPGQPESFTVNDLPSDTTYHFAVKSTDAAGNVSAISNIATGTTDPADATPPEPLADLGFSLVDANDVTLTWTATGDDGTTGTATAYEIRYSTNPIDAGNWATATLVNTVPTPVCRRYRGKYFRRWPYAQ